jgi:nuclear pore complex protein Nup93
MERTGLIPLDEENITISRRAEEFKNSHETIARTFPDLILKTMDTISKLYKALKASPYSDAGRQKVIDVERRVMLVSDCLCRSWNNFAERRLV